MHRWLLALSFVAVVAMSAEAQTGTASAGAAGTIDPGMSRAQVIERLGKPNTARTYQGTTYLLYSNKCGKKCGMQDLVILDHDVVVDAVFRSPDRHYTGTSSSPVATLPNSRSARNQTLAIPGAPPAVAQPTAAERVTPGVKQEPADSTSTSTSRPPQDSATTSTSRPPAENAAPAATAPVPYGKPSTTPPPADSSKTPTSHPPAENASSNTSHPPKPPK